jgi:hypothetical protein
VKLAVICSIYNEEVLLPQFLNHYSPQVDTVFLLDNESTDRSRLLACGYPNVVVSTYSSGGQFSDVALSEAYSRKRRECVGQYDYVIIADCDEFIVPKRGASLREAIELAQPNEALGLCAEFFWTHGWNMWPKPGEPPYDPARPLLSQRTTGIASSMYSKPCIIRPESRLGYEHGRHDLKGRVSWKPSTFEASQFYLLHYIGFDEAMFVRRGMERTARFAQINVDLGTSVQYRNKTEALFLETFRMNSSDPALVTVPFKAPDVARRRLEIGSGGSPTPGHDTLDKDPRLKPTYSFDLTSTDWAIPGGLYDEVLLIHVLEHLPTSQVGLVLRRILKVMKFDGTLRIHVPNGPLIAKAYLEHPEQLLRVQAAIYGPETETDPAFARKALYDFATLRAALLSAGFWDVEEVTQDYEDHHDPHWTWMGGRLSLKVRARKPRPWS